MQDIPDVSTHTRSISSGPVRSIELVQLRVHRFHPHQLPDEPVDPQYANVDGVRNLCGVIHEILNAEIEGDSGQAGRGEGHGITPSNRASVVTAQPINEPDMEELTGRQDETIGANNDATLAGRWFDCILSMVWVFFNPFLPN